ncbi:MAG: hypothetical protein PHY92_08345 [Alphaproteobacteria bacterium]|nr:hypothetical protein [Alphaproteobacteria bacterium]
MMFKERPPEKDVIKKYLEILLPVFSEEAEKNGYLLAAEDPYTTSRFKGLFSTINATANAKANYAYTTIVDFTLSGKDERYPDLEGRITIVNAFGGREIKYCVYSEFDDGFRREYVDKSSYTLDYALYRPGLQRRLIARMKKGIGFMFTAYEEAVVFPGSERLEPEHKAPACLPR